MMDLNGVILRPYQIEAHEATAAAIRKYEGPFFLNMSVSLAVQSFLQSHQISAMIKWPNDIYVADKKIAGILEKIKQADASEKAKLFDALIALL